MTHTTTTLNRLIETCFDGAKGYSQAAKIVKSEHYKQLFRSFARQREMFARRLQSIVTRRGAAPSVSDTTFFAATHRGWMTMRASQSDKPAPILAECRRGDQVAIASYQNALNSELPAEIRPIIEKQYQNIRSVCARINALHDVMPLNRAMEQA